MIENSGAGVRWADRRHAARHEPDPDEPEMGDIRLTVTRYRLRKRRCRHAATLLAGASMACVLGAVKYPGPLSGAAPPSTEVARTTAAPQCAPGPSSTGAAGESTISVAASATVGAGGIEDTPMDSASGGYSTASNAAAVPSAAEESAPASGAGT